MYYRMIRLHFEEDRLEDVTSFLESEEDRMSSIDGLLSADIATTGEGEAMIIAAFDSASNYEASTWVIDAILDGMQPHLTSTPHGHEGAVVYSFRE